MLDIIILDYENSFIFKDKFSYERKAEVKLNSRRLGPFLWSRITIDFEHEFYQSYILLYGKPINLREIKVARTNTYYVEFYSSEEKRNVVEERFTRRLVWENQKSTDVQRLMKYYAARPWMFPHFNVTKTGGAMHKQPNLFNVEIEMYDILTKGEFMAKVKEDERAPKPRHGWGAG